VENGMLRWRAFAGWRVVHGIAFPASEELEILIAVKTTIAAGLDAATA
jgi:hypothetical protein